MQTFNRKKWKDRFAQGQKNTKEAARRSLLGMRYSLKELIIC